MAEEGQSFSSGDIQARIARVKTHSLCAAAAAPVASVVSDSVRPHRRQPTRLPCPWDSPGKNTGVGCYFLLQCMKVKSESEVAQPCPTLRDPMDCGLPGSSVHGSFQARVLEWGAIAFSQSLWASSIYSNLQLVNIKQGVKERAHPVFFRVVNGRTRIKKVKRTKKQILAKYEKW